MNSQKISREAMTYPFSLSAKEQAKAHYINGRINADQFFRVMRAEPNERERLNYLKSILYEQESK